MPKYREDAELLAARIMENKEEPGFDLTCALDEIMMAFSRRSEGRPMGLVVADVLTAGSFVAARAVLIGATTLDAAPQSLFDKMTEQTKLSYMALESGVMKAAGLEPGRRPDA